MHNDEPLMDIIVQTAFFLEHSGPEAVDEDAAVGMMEQIMTALKKLEPADRDRFLAYVDRRAATAGSEKERAFFENFASYFGLDEA